MPEMDKISFQNGFLCGMATRGLTRSGELYKPRVWNDEGIYTYFYIDFKRSLKPFALGMLQESIYVYDNAMIPITAFEKVTAGIYKLYCNIASKPRGVNITARELSYLTYSNGIRLDKFTVKMYVAGQESFTDEYWYEEAENTFINFVTGSEETVTIGEISHPSIADITESISYEYAAITVTEENPTIVLV